MRRRYETSASRGGARCSPSSSSLLASSIGMRSSSAYATRTHLPYVSQSMLVAHCIASSPSPSRYSTRPTPTTTTTTSSYLTSSSPSHYSSSSSSAAALYTRPTRLQPTPSYNSAGRISASSYSSSHSSSHSSSYSSRYSSSAYSSRYTSSSSQRPVSPALNAWNYYKPLRLSERPLLSALSGYKPSYVPSARSTTNASSLRPPERPISKNEKQQTEPLSAHSRDAKSVKILIETENKQQNSDANLAQPQPQASAQQTNDADADNNDWQQDITRCISRNKYLIKFKEIDRQQRPMSTSPTLAALDDDDDDDHDHDDGVNKENENVKAESKVQEEIVDRNEQEAVGVFLEVPTGERQPKQSSLRSQSSSEQPKKKKKVKIKTSNKQPSGDIATETVTATVTVTVNDTSLESTLSKIQNVVPLKLEEAQKENLIEVGVGVEFKDQQSPTKTTTATSPKVTSPPVKPTFVHPKEAKSFEVPKLTKLDLKVTTVETLPKCAPPCKASVDCEELKSLPAQLQVSKLELKEKTEKKESIHDVEERKTVESLKKFQQVEAEEKSTLKLKTPKTPPQATPKIQEAKQISKLEKEAPFEEPKLQQRGPKSPERIENLKQQQQPAQIFASVDKNLACDVTLAAVAEFCSEVPKSPSLPQQPATPPQTPPQISAQKESLEEPIGRREQSLGPAVSQSNEEIQKDKSSEQADDKQRPTKLKLKLKRDSVESLAGSGDVEAATTTTTTTTTTKLKSGKVKKKAKEGVVDKAKKSKLKSQPEDATPPPSLSSPSSSSKDEIVKVKKRKKTAESVEGGQAATPTSPPLEDACIDNSAVANSSEKISAQPGNKLVGKLKKIVNKLSPAKKIGDSSSTRAAGSGQSTPEAADIDIGSSDNNNDNVSSPAEQTAPSQEAIAAANGKQRIRFRDYHYDDFNLLSVLGHGGWGFVFLAELKGHELYFATKAIKKQTIAEDDDYDSIMIERKMLTLGNINPFICKLFCTFETEAYLFFVMEFCSGGDLMFHVQNEGKFSEVRCKFYAAEIICAIRFLHNRGIVYRDLKLDNILLSSNGHIRLVDFGMCQCRTYREEMLPSNFCGTPEYIAPEIIKGVPYNHSVDWWSFGVLLYEMAIGKMPFRGGDENELLWNVCYEQIHYPMFLTRELTALLKALLEREPTLRMGMATCKAGDICQQLWFRDIDWNLIEQMRVEPPFVPKVDSPKDVQNFDADFTEAPVELSPVDSAVLAAIDQTQFQAFAYTNPEMFANT